MTISQKELQEFKTLWYEHFGCTLSDQDAYEEASRMLHLMQAVFELDRFNSPSCSM